MDTAVLGRDYFEDFVPDSGFGTYAMLTVMVNLP